MISSEISERVSTGSEAPRSAGNGPVRLGWTWVPAPARGKDSESAARAGHVTGPDGARARTAGIDSEWAHSARLDLDSGPGGREGLGQAGPAPRPSAGPQGENAPGRGVRLTGWIQQ